MKDRTIFLVGVVPAVLMIAVIIVVVAWLTHQNQTFTSIHGHCVITTLRDVFGNFISSVKVCGK